ncbi:SRPBCC domain-containing protein [Paenibacillus sp. S-38]|uniref:SRPBCC domain-containing protein n=1 Tax=Paenibacillus sp. S-38 TaxID=3416710 RepID=UPI003CE98134
MKPTIPYTRLEAVSGRPPAEWITLVHDSGAGGGTADSIADWLHREHGLSPAWSEVTAAAYLHQHKGIPPVGLTAKTGFQIGVRRTAAASPQVLWELLTSSRALPLWLGTVDVLPLTPRAPYTTREGIGGEIRVVHPPSQLRMTYCRADWPQPSTLQVRLLAAAGGRTTLSFHQENLPDLFLREEMRLHWDQAAGGLTALL